MRFPNAMPNPFDSFWPVGSVFISTVATNPAVLLGFGVWVPFASGRVLVGQDVNQTEFDVLGETGGAKTVTLDATMMPAHTHVQNPHLHLQDPHQHGEQLQGNTTGTTTGTHLMGSAATAGSLRTAGQSTLAATATNQNTTAVNQSTGGGLAHPNLPPYIVVNLWNRTA